jgi:hypothetical protein
MNRTTTNGFACGSAIYRALQNCLIELRGYYF